MLDRNIFESPPAEIRDVRVVMTVVNGERVYVGSE
jgi:predicted amidohydrolase YtcJ